MVDLGLMLEGPMTTQGAYQTRSEETGLEFYETLDDALAATVKDPTIWKVSFTGINGDRVRLIRGEDFGA